MTTKITRRHLLLAGGAVGATEFFLHGFGASPASGARAASSPATDPRVARLVELSRDEHGDAHIERAAFLGPAGAFGSLGVSRAELDDLVSAIERRDFAAFRARGLHVDGQKYVFIKEDDDGTVVHAVRRGRHFVTVRATRAEIVVATSGPDMAHGRAVEAVYQYLKPTMGVA